MANPSRNHSASAVASAVLKSTPCWLLSTYGRTNSAACIGATALAVMPIIVAATTPRERHVRRRLQQRLPSQRRDEQGREAQQDALRPSSGHTADRSTVDERRPVGVAQEQPQQNGCSARSRPPS